MAENDNNENNSAPVNEADMVSTYANFCRVTNTPEELIVDFGMNAKPAGSGGGQTPVDISQRVVLNFFTAKRLLHALHMSVQRHETLFGKIETDISKRFVAKPGDKAKPQDKT